MLESLADLLERQHGVLSRGQALSHGLSRHAVAHQIAARRWQRVHPGVFATVTGLLDVDQRIWAGVLYAGADAKAGFRTAWWLSDRKLPEPEVVDVVIPDPRIVHPQPGLVVHRTRRLHPDDVHPTASPPRFRLERSVLDCAATAPDDDQAVALLASAIQRRTTTATRLREAMRRCPNLRRRALLTDLLDLAEVGAESLLEVLHHRITTSHGLPAPDRQRRLGAAIVDAAYDCPNGSVLVVELDGKLGHLGTDSWWQDMQRDNGHTVATRGVLRFPAFMLITKPHVIAETIAAALRARGWTGEFRCPRGCAGDG